MEKDSFHTNKPHCSVYLKDAFKEFQGINDSSVLTRCVKMLYDKLGKEDRKDVFISALRFVSPFFII